MSYKLGLATRKEKNKTRKTKKKIGKEIREDERRRNQKTMEETKKRNPKIAQLIVRERLAEEVNHESKEIVRENSSI